MPAEWPTPEAIEAVAARLDEAGWTHPQTGPPAVAVATDLLTIAAKASPVIPAPKCKTCGGEGDVAVNFGLHSTKPPDVLACPDCHGTGVAEVNPVPTRERERTAYENGRRDRTRAVVAHLRGASSLMSMANQKKWLNVAADLVEERWVDDAEPVAEVIPVARISYVRDLAGPCGNHPSCHSHPCIHSALAALLDEHTRKEPTTPENGSG
jgi:hypothetical protein